MTTRIDKFTHSFQAFMDSFDPTIEKWDFVKDHPSNTGNYHTFTLTMHMEYIKGEQITPATAPQFKNIVLRDLVNSPNPISAAGYAPSNFIFNNEGLYFVDLEDMREISKEDRMKKFLKEPKNGWIK